MEHFNFYSGTMLNIYEKIPLESISYNYYAYDEEARRSPVPEGPLFTVDSIPTITLVTISVPGASITRSPRLKSLVEGCRVSCLDEVLPIHCKACGFHQVCAIHYISPISCMKCGEVVKKDKMSTQMIFRLRRTCPEINLFVEKNLRFLLAGREITISKSITLKTSDKALMTILQDMKNYSEFFTFPEAVFTVKSKKTLPNFPYVDLSGLNFAAIFPSQKYSMFSAYLLFLNGGKVAVIREIQEVLTSFFSGRPRKATVCVNICDSHPPAMLDFFLNGFSLKEYISDEERAQFVKENTEGQCTILKKAFSAKLNRMLASHDAGFGAKQR